MRAPLPSIVVWIDDQAVRGSSTVGTIGSDVLVFGTALPDLGLTLTSSCLIVADGATIGVTQRHSSHRDERLQYREHRHDPAAAASLASACLLEHARDLRNVVASHVQPGASVGVDVGDDAIDAVQRAWPLSRTA